VRRGLSDLGKFGVRSPAAGFLQSDDVRRLPKPSNLFTIDDAFLACVTV
jgi:hypothetical protein